MKRTKQNGITLIALVITIIVLLILAGVSIATLTGENGILTRANEAKTNTEEATAREKVEVEVLGSYENNGKIDLARLKENIENAGGRVIGDAFPVTVVMDGYNFSVDSEGNITLIGKNNGDLVAGGEWNGKINTPKLAEGMIPIKWDDSQTKWVICSEHDTEWYNYMDQSSGVDGTSKWANVMLSDGKYYAQNCSNVNTQGKEVAKIGQVIDETELGSMFVWIPRYAYQIEEGYHSNNEGTINIAFLEGTKIYNTGDSITYTSQGNRETGNIVNSTGEGNWNEHSAFNYGGTIISGIWVAKFEASSTTDTPDTNFGGGNVTNLNVKVLPGKKSWRNIRLGNCYTNCINMNSSENASYYGISQDDNKIDPHLIKNSEWGAIAYLAYSSYGRNGNEVTINNSSSFITGSAGNSINASADIGTTTDYANSKGVLASTTGNTTGIYDMSGGAWDIVAGYVNNNNSELLSSGKELLESNEMKHKDVYEINNAIGDTKEANYNNSKEIFGNAVWETSNYFVNANSWNKDASYFVSGTYPVFVRGGTYSQTTDTGIFAYRDTNSSNNSNLSFRPSIVVY